MATFTWSNGNGGNWSDDGNWSPNGVPGPIDTALIDLAGQYAINLDVVEIGSVTLDAAGVTFTPSGTLKLDGVFDVKAGTLVISHALQGGMLVADGGTIDYAGGTLDGVTVNGLLDLSAAGSSLTITDGIGFTGPAPGQILDTGAGSALVFSGAQTLHDVAVTVGSGASLTSGALTLDADSSLTANGSSLVYGNLDNRGTISLTSTALSSNATIENEGTLSLDSDRFNSIGLSSLVNTGTLNFSGAAASGSTMAVGALTNTGDINILKDAHVTVNSYSMADIFSDTGTITIDPTSTLELFNETYTLSRIEGIAAHVANQGGTVLIDGTLDLGGATVDISADNPAAAGYELNDATIQNGTIETDGTGIHYTRDFNTLANVTIDGTLNVNGGANTQLIIDGDCNFTAGAPTRIIETTPDSYLEFDGSRTLDDANLTLGNSSFYVVGSSGQSSGDGTLTLDANSLVTLTGGEYFGSPLNDLNAVNGVLDNKGTIIAIGGGLSSGADVGGPLIENEGLFSETEGSVSDLLQLSNSGTLSLSGGSSLVAQTFDNTGTVTIADGSSLTITAPVELYLPVGQFDNSGTVRISTGATLKLGNGAPDLGTVSFDDNTGTLVLSGLNSGYSHFNPGSTDGTLNMFQAGDVLDLGPIPSVQTVSLGTYSIAHSGDTLTVDLGVNVLDNFILTGGDYTDASFTLTGDIITTDAPCFCAGTRILANRGERAVEHLAVGDVVITRQDGVEALAPVRWIGRRRVDIGSHPEPEHVEPIRIGRDAIGPGLPVRDLFVSPDHALYLDGMLIQARQLVNHMTITHDRGRAAVTYYHVELDRHTILLADGLPCESYLDTGNRGQFDAAGTVVPLRNPAADRAQAACAPVVIATDIIRPIWQRLADRAAAAGYGVPALQAEADLEPWLETITGTRLTRADGNRFALPPGCQQVRLRSGSDRPTTLAPWSDDRRRLGIAVNSIRLHHGNTHRELPLSKLGEDGGWWPLEGDGDLAWRWTDGDGWIALREPADAIEITLHATMPVATRTAPDPQLKAS